MNEPILVVMAAGLGSRYGGLKQLVPVGPNEQAIMDYSLYDAKRAGFTRVVFVISESMAEAFPQDIQARVGRDLDVSCVVQRLGDMPGNTTVPQGRTKPWGTGHAVRACREVVDAPFAAINADDYYGAHGFAQIYEFLTRAECEQSNTYAMVGFELTKTLSKTGHVARGICRIGEKGKLVEIHERTHIVDSCDGPLYTEDQQHYVRLPEDAVASMNLWGFPSSFMKELDGRFDTFVQKALLENPHKAEYFLPEVVGQMLESGHATVDVLKSQDRWYGMTYQEDRPVVAEAIARLIAEGRYPQRLWR